jgi:hypothetical protein
MSLPPPEKSCESLKLSEKRASGNGLVALPTEK